MREKRLSPVLVLVVLVAAAAVAGVALLSAGKAASTAGGFPFAPPGPAVATTTMLSTSTASPAPQGAPLKLTATVTPMVATGKVQFKDSTVNIGDPVRVSNGSASATTSELTAGPHQLTAVFTPDSPAAYGFSISPAVPFTISGATATSTVLSTSASSPVTQGTSLTLTATLTPPTAIGMVQFKDGTANIGDPVTVNNGTATQTTTTLAVGQRQLTAVFTPTNTMLYGPSTSPAMPFTISGATATTTTLSASSTANPVVTGSTVMLTATVSPSAADGTVQFEDSGTSIGDAVTVSGGTATQTTTTLTAASHQLTAVFTPTNTMLYSSSTSPAVTFVVTGMSATTTTMSASPARQVFEDTPVTMTANVASSSATGTVQFRDGTTNVGGPVTVTNGTASRSATFGVGPHQMTATFTPTTTALYGSSISSPVTFTVQTRPILNANLNPARQQDPPGDLGPRPPRRSLLPGLGAGVGGSGNPNDPSNPIVGGVSNPVLPPGGYSLGAVNKPTRRWENREKLLPA